MMAGENQSTDFGSPGQQALNTQETASPGSNRLQGEIFYNAALGRFTQPDSVRARWAAGLNRYSYILNNPVDGTAQLDIRHVIEKLWQRLRKRYIR